MQEIFFLKKCFLHVHDARFFKICAVWLYREIWKRLKYLCFSLLCFILFSFRAEMSVDRGRHALVNYVPIQRSNNYRCRVMRGRRGESGRGRWRGGRRGISKGWGIRMREVVIDDFLKHDFVYARCVCCSISYILHVECELGCFGYCPYVVNL
jgi:hypothetical protein